MHKRTENIKVQAKKTLDRNQIQKSMAQNFFFLNILHKKLFFQKMYTKKSVKLIYFLVMSFLAYIYVQSIYILCEI